MKITRAIALFISLLLILGVIAGGCGGTEYARADAVKLGIGFSFEYPPSYTPLTPDAFEDNGREPSVSLLYSDPERTQEKADIQIYVMLSPPIAGRQDATAWSEEHIRVLEENDAYFQLYERTNVEVAGISGYKVVYFTTILGNYLNSENLIVRDVYFDYKGYIWKISVLAVEEFDDQAESVFEHLIESFQFTD
jgi:hypothetical protein